MAEVIPEIDRKVVLVAIGEIWCTRIVDEGVERDPVVAGSFRGFRVFEAKPPQLDG